MSLFCWKGAIDTDVTASTNWLIYYAGSWANPFNPPTSTDDVYIPSKYYPSGAGQVETTTHPVLTTAITWNKLYLGYTFPTTTSSTAQKDDLLGSVDLNLSTFNLTVISGAYFYGFLSSGGGDVVLDDGSTSYLENGFIGSGTTLFYIYVGPSSGANSDTTIYVSDTDGTSAVVYLKNVKIHMRDDSVFTDGDTFANGSVVQGYDGGTWMLNLYNSGTATVKLKRTSLYNLSNYLYPINGAKHLDLQYCVISRDIASRDLLQHDVRDNFIANTRFGNYTDFYGTFDLNDGFYRNKSSVMYQRNTADTCYSVYGNCGYLVEGDGGSKTALARGCNGNESYYICDDKTTDLTNQLKPLTFFDLGFYSPIANNMMVWYSVEGGTGVMNFMSNQNSNDCLYYTGIVPIQSGVGSVYSEYKVELEYKISGDNATNVFPIDIDEFLDGVKTHDALIKTSLPVVREWTTVTHTLTPDGSNNGVRVLLQRENTGGTWYDAVLKIKSMKIFGVDGSGNETLLWYLPVSYEKWQVVNHTDRNNYFNALFNYASELPAGHTGFVNKTDDNIMLLDTKHDITKSYTWVRNPHDDDLIESLRRVIGVAARVNIQNGTGYQLYYNGSGTFTLYRLNGYNDVTIMGSITITPAEDDLFGLYIDDNNANIFRLYVNGSYETFTPAGNIDSEFTNPTYTHGYSGMMWFAHYSYLAYGGVMTPDLVEVDSKIYIDYLEYQNVITVSDTEMIKIRNAELSDLNSKPLTIHAEDGSIIDIVTFNRDSAVDNPDIHVIPYDGADVTISGSQLSGVIAKFIVDGVEISGSRRVVNTVTDKPPIVRYYGHKIWLGKPDKEPVEINPGSLSIALAVPVSETDFLAALEDLRNTNTPDKTITYFDENFYITGKLMAYSKTYKTKAMTIVKITIEE